MDTSATVAHIDARQLHQIRATLLTWYDRAHRDFPWRRIRDPYAVMVSEVMLQQTQASRVAQAFVAFMTRFPTTASLARAPQAAVLTQWSGLGYNRRALALQRAAALADERGWPRDVAGLERLPGVGPYTARAIASLAFGRPVGVVDTNVRRWLVRRFGLSSNAQPARLQALADGLAGAGDDGRTDAWTHATMEFGAAVCTSRRPRCASCPVADGCPSRDQPPTVPVTRQPSFAGSDRALRGALLRRLSAAPEHAMSLRTARRMVGTDVERIVAGLAADGLVHRSGSRLVLGGREHPEGPATIGP